MRTLIRHPRCLTEAAAQRLIETLTAERDRAFQDGYDLGYVAGVEAGLHELLEDAATALGRAA